MVYFFLRLPLVNETQSLDKALVAWGVKSPPGEPEIDFKEKIKSAGLAGALAYGGTELAFWIISVPLAVVGYHQTTGEWLDLTTLEGKEKASVPKQRLRVKEKCSCISVGQSEAAFSRFFRLGLSSVVCCLVVVCWSMWVCSYVQSIFVPTWSERAPHVI